MKTIDPDGRPGRHDPIRDGARDLLASVERLTGAGVWSYDSATNDMWWSEQARQILRLEPDAPRDVDAIVECFDAAEHDRVQDLFATALSASERIETDIALDVEGTTERYVRLRAEPRVGDDGAVRIHGTVQDVTDAKRQEQRIEVLRRTGQQLRYANSRREVAEIMAETSKNILGYVNTTIRLVDPSEDVLRTVVSTEECVERAGERPDYPVDEETPAARTYRTGEPELHSDHRATDDRRDRGELQSGLYVPIGDHGVLSAGDVVLDAFDERDIEAASLLGQLAAKAITRIGWTKRARAV